MNTIFKITIAAIVSVLFSPASAATPDVTIRSLQVPVLTGLAYSPAERLTVQSVASGRKLTKMSVDFSGSTDPADIVEVALYAVGDQSGLSLTDCVGSQPTQGLAKIDLVLDAPLNSDTASFLLGVKLREPVDLSHKIMVSCTTLQADGQDLHIQSYSPLAHRTGVALHSKGQDNVASCRIPGIATATDGTLLAICDARRDSSRDLQGDIDIVLRRSSDGGATWTPMQSILDMGEWGGLPERYNGVSDACILVDKTTGRVFVAGLWMHGLLDSAGQWIENLDSTSTCWTHQWKGRGSQPGLGVRQTCQFLIASSDDNGQTWTAPVNITPTAKRPEWWLYAPSPGQGIMLADGTLVFPTQGRDSIGMPFSNIAYSTDHGRSWTASNPAYSDVTECNAVQLPDGHIMLNMRDNRNRGHRNPNGRRICVSSDLGHSWQEHPTSHRVLTEPTCMASLHRHDYTDSAGNPASVLLFANPNHHKLRKNLTLKTSFDNGLTWPEESWILFDETRGSGYSSITSVDPGTIGILYESGLADLVFIQVGLDEIPGL